MKWNWIVAGTAWAGIVALAWRLADQRSAVCGSFDADCRFDAAATRDGVLIWGLSIPLALFVLLTIAGRARIGRLNLRWPRRGRTPTSTSRELVPLERTKD